MCAPQRVLASQNRVYAVLLRKPRKIEIASPNVVKGMGPYGGKIGVEREVGDRRAHRDGGRGGDAGPRAPEAAGEIAVARGRAAHWMGRESSSQVGRIVREGRAVQRVWPTCCPSLSKKLQRLRKH